MDEDLVWYVAYGSNLCAQRLACYLGGGTPAGARRPAPGARDTTPPRTWERLDLSHPLWFGGPSRTWNGGPAFLDVDRPGVTVGRAWLVTREQFIDIAAQENGRRPGTFELSPQLVTHGGVAVPDGTYGRVAVLASPDERPAATVTCVTPPQGRPPDPAYVQLIRIGLGECGLAEDEIDQVLGAQPQLAAPDTGQTARSARRQAR